MDRFVLLVAALLGAACATTELVVHEFGPDDALFTTAIVCGMHPREVITRDVCDSWVRLLQDSPPRKMRVVLVPNANPEGVEQLERDECWRGNARGVDLNRNWPLLDCETPDDDEHVLVEQEWSHGDHPLSEWETRQLYDLLQREQPHLLLAIHSGIQAFLTPYDACARSPINYESHVKLAKWLRRDICDECIVARSPRILYYSRGTMTDWAYHHLQVPLVFTLEIFEGPEPDDPTSCAQLFSPAPNTPTYIRVVSKWRRMLKRLINMDSDDYLALLEMADVVVAE